MAQQVLRGGTRPVLLIRLRNPSGTGEIGPWTPRSILVPLDGSG
ncbi:MAG TPA: hypothetical protein VEW91_06080 [bacterium]|nr:hypothetical protein [bacterium]